MDVLQSLLKYLPEYDEFSNVLINEPEADYILKIAAADIAKIQESATCELKQPSEMEEGFYLIHCLVDKQWERIHTGHFSEVPLATRQIYALACYYKIFYLLIASLTRDQVEKCSEILDEAMLIGCTQNLYENNGNLQKELNAFFNKYLGDLVDFKLPTIEPVQRQKYRCDIRQIDCPSIEVFQQQCFRAQKPALLLNTIAHWPALEKWRNLNYILKVAGNRTVPIEIGSNYSTDEWSQQLVKIRDFLQRQFATKSRNIEYLAQHELFDQIPEMKSDIRTPDYCTLGSKGSVVDIKAWLGPKGTISPLHYDPKHNMLCQIFGGKKVILASPMDTANLYPHETKFLSNTSQIDAADLDFKKFPLSANARFYELTLQAGDCLYMPPKWWHYVRAESESFSVSFWWE